MSADARRAEGQERMVLAAFVGYQMGAAGKKTFKTYLEELGLYGDAPQSMEPVFDKAAADARLDRMGIKRKKGKH